MAKGLFDEACGKLADALAPLMGLPRTHRLLGLGVCDPTNLDKREKKRDRLVKEH